MTEGYYSVATEEGGGGGGGGRCEAEIEKRERLKRASGKNSKPAAE